MKIKINSDKNIEYVKVKLIKAKKAKDILSIYNKIELKTPKIPIIKKINIKKKKVSLLIFEKYSKKEIENFISNLWKDL